MNTLQETLISVLDGTCEPQELLPSLVIPQLREWGIHLSDSERTQLEDEFQKITLEAATLNLTNFRFLDSTESRLITAENRMPIAKKTLMYVLGLAMAEKTRNLVEGLEGHATSILSDEREQQLQLEQRVSEEWQEPLDLLGVHIALAKGVRSLFDDQVLSNAAHSGDLVFPVLANLHARACQVSSEILVLLRFGLSEGAFARWRTLYELSAVSQFIKKNGKEVAERYLFHNPLERSKLARQYLQDIDPGNSSNLPQEFVEDLAALQGSLVKKYGKEFERDYGWAAPELKGTPNLRRIAESVGLGSSYSAYKLASSSIHASALRSFQSSVPGDPLGRAEHAVPSSIDLKSPGYHCARSLEEITTTLLKSQPGLDDGATLKRGAIIRSLYKLASDVLKAFDRVESKVEF